MLDEKSKYKIELERTKKEFKKLQKELEETKTIFKIKVEARTKELRELAENLDEKVKERTKELEESRTALMNMLEDAEESRKALTNVLEDVDEARRRAEEERDNTKAIITNFADGLMILDKENKIILINPEGERFLDVNAKEVEGKILGALIKKPSLKKLAELLSAEETKEGLFRKELSFKKPTERVLEVTTVSLAPREENVVILHDISREKLIERMKSEFVSLAAHQLRTPLSAIKWTLRMLLDGDLGKITEEQRGFIEKTYRSNERMISLINDLLDVTRIEEGRYLYKPVLTQIENVVQFVIDSFKEKIRRKKIKLEFKKPRKKLPEVKVDVEKVRSAVNNLLDNAIRYTPVGGRVTASLKCGKKEIELSVKDTGVGIPEDQKERVFTKFFRGANVMRMETEGTGLGLFITKNIIEAHGGRVWFESEENKGSVFHFTLPIKKS